MTDFKMPSLGADMESATVVDWYVKPGDRVKKGGIVGAVETDKGVIDIESFEDAVVEEIVVPIGENVPVGTVLARFRTDGATAEEPLAAPAPTAAAPAVPQPSPVVPPPTAPQPAAPAQPPAEQRVRITPLARRLATELHVDLSIVHGTGPDGAIERADVEQAARRKGEPVLAAPVPASPPASVRPVPDFQAGMRRAIAAAMSLSNREIPHYYLATRIDMSRALAWLEAENRKRAIAQRLLPAVLLVKAVARALGETPELNGYWKDGRHQPENAIHIGFAIALRQGGLITPALHDADRKSLDDLMEAMRDLITRTRSGRLRGSEMTDATITVTNLGDMGVETVYGVIYPPQVALVGFGKITEQPWAANGMLGVRPVLSATLAADHRATDGHQGARFLDALDRQLQEVEKL